MEGRAVAPCSGKLNALQDNIAQRKTLGRDFRALRVLFVAAHAEDDIVERY
jgi:hypothetical protein